MTGKFEMGKQNPGIPRVLRSRRERPRTCKMMSPKLAPFPHTLVVQIRVDCNPNHLGPASRESLRGCLGPRLLLAWSTMISPPPPALSRLLLLTGARRAARGRTRPHPTDKSHEARPDAKELTQAGREESDSLQSQKSALTSPSRFSNLYFSSVLPHTTPLPPLFPGL